nr:hypothetical protein Iba_chr10dCG6920 [Ipomoea batatas]
MMGRMFSPLLWAAPATSLAQAEIFCSKKNCRPTGTPMSESMPEMASGESFSGSRRLQGAQKCSVLMGKEIQERFGCKSVDELGTTMGKPVLGFSDMERPMLRSTRHQLGCHTPFSLSVSSGSED